MALYLGTDFCTWDPEDGIIFPYKRVDCHGLHTVLFWKQQWFIDGQWSGVGTLEILR